MSEKTIGVRFHHPLDGEPLKMELPAAMTFREILKLLYGRGYIRPKPADYAFIIGGHICAMNKALSAYVPGEYEGDVDIEVNGKLSIMC
jgi:hypothetical protein